MSLSQALTKNIEMAIESYVKTVSEKYNLDKDQLLSLWFGSEVKSVSKKATVETIDMDDLSIERLHKCNKAELVALCKSKGTKCTGTKEVLIDRLLGKEESGMAKPKVEKKTETKEKPKKADRAIASVDVVKKLTADIPAIPIRRNAHGNLEHPETGLVFDRKTETVIGKQEDDGTIADLTDEDIEACKRFKFKYAIPDNLDKKDNLDNVKIEELGNDDSDVEIVEDDDEDEVELEEDEADEVEDEVEDDD